MALDPSDPRPGFWPTALPYRPRSGQKQTRSRKKAEHSRFAICSPT